MARHYERRFVGPVIPLLFLAGLLASPMLGSLASLEACDEGFQWRGPIFGHSITVFDMRRIVAPGTPVWVRLVREGQSLPLPGPVEFGIYRIDEGNVISGTVSVTYSTEAQLEGAFMFSADLPWDAPARYCARLIVRDTNGQTIDQLVWIMEVPEQKLNASLTVNKRVFEANETVTYTLTNYGPTWISFDGSYCPHFAFASLSYWGVVGASPGWVLPDFLASSRTITCLPLACLCELPPGSNTSASLDFTNARPGLYKVSEMVGALGTNPGLGATLEANFTVTGVVPLVTAQPKPPGESVGPTEQPSVAQGAQHPWLGWGLPLIIGSALAAGLLTVWRIRRRPRPSGDATGVPSRLPA